MNLKLNCDGLINGKIVQILAVLSSTLNVISDGMQLAWTSPIVPILLSADTPIKIEESHVIWLENAIMYGSILGVPLTIYAANNFKRKTTILLGAFINLTSWMVIAFTSSFYVLLSARLLAGIGSEVAFVSIPTYISEISDSNIRGSMSAMDYIMTLIGIIMIYAVGPNMSITGSSFIGASFIILQLLTFTFMPESPYYFIMQEREEEARSSLKVLRWRDDVEDELKEISTAVKRQRSESGRFVDLFLIDSNRKAVVIMIVLNVSQNFGGFSVMLMNLHNIVGKESLIDADKVAVMFAVVMLAACFGASLIVDQVGRKVLLISSSLLTSLVLLLLAVYIHLKNCGYDFNNNYSWAPTILVMLYSCVFKYGLGMVPIVMNGELFSVSINAIGMTTCDMIYILSSIATIYLYQLLVRINLDHVVFYIFSFLCWFPVIFTYFYVPETKGKTLEEIQLMLKGDNDNIVIANEKYIQKLTKV